MEVVVGLNYKDRTMNTDWVPYEKYGSYYRLVNGVLCFSPMLINGEREEGNGGEVEWDNITYEEQMECVAIISELIDRESNKLSNNEDGK